MRYFPISISHVGKSRKCLAPLSTGRFLVTASAPAVASSTVKSSSSSRARVGAVGMVELTADTTFEKDTGVVVEGAPALRLVGLRHLDDRLLDLVRGGSRRAGTHPVLEYSRAFAPAGGESV